MTSDSLLDGHLHRGCGGRYARAAEVVNVRLSGMTAAVERVLFRCDRCGDERRTVEQREQAEHAAVAAMRAQHGLLEPREIRQLRERLGLTHEQLGDLLYGVPSGIVRGWERGRYVQNPEVDTLIRALEDPDTLQQRAARAGVALPTPEGATPDGATPDGAPGDGEATDPPGAETANGVAPVAADMGGAVADPGLRG